MMSGGQKKGWRMKKNLSLESLLESKNRRVNSILKLDIVVIALLQKGFGINLANYKKLCHVLDSVTRCAEGSMLSQASTRTTNSAESNGLGLRRSGRDSEYHVLANRTCLPGKVRTRRIDLVQHRPFVV
jgi:hypothetical protein